MKGILLMLLNLKSKTKGSISLFAGFSFPEETEICVVLMFRTLCARRPSLPAALGCKNYTYTEQPGLGGTQCWGQINVEFK